MKRFYRSQTEKMIAGIIGGIAETYSVDPNLLRLLLVFLGVATGIVPFLVTYIFGWIIIPKGPAEDAASVTGQFYMRDGRDGCWAVPLNWDRETAEALWARSCEYLAAWL